MTVLQSIIKLRRMKKAGYLYRGQLGWNLAYNYKHGGSWDCRIARVACSRRLNCYQVPIEWSSDMYSCSYKTDFTKNI